MAARTLRRASLWFLPLAILGIGASAAARIESVVVYSDRAQVTRSQRLDCGKGSVAFTELPTTIDTRTLSAALTGGGGALQGVSHQEVPTATRGRAEPLERQLRVLSDRIATRQSLVQGTSRATTRLGHFAEYLKRAVGEQAVGRRPSIASWKAATDLLRQQALAAINTRRKLEHELRELRRQQQDVIADLRRLKEAQRPSTLTATVYARCQGSRTVKLSYVVPGATWRIAYRAKATPASRRVTITAQALVQQGTGEDWDNVALSVSTANVRREPQPPRIQQMTVSTHKPHTTKKVLVRRFEHRQRLDDSVAQQPTGAARGPTPGKEAEAALVLKALDRATVKPDGREVLVRLASKTVSATFLLESVPKLYPYVYDRVTVGNPFPFTMLAGPVTLFRGQEYRGTSYTEDRAPREQFALSLGVRSDILVDRFVKEEKLVGASTFGSTKKLRHRYEIQVGNWTGARAKIRVRENVPVARVSDIKVVLEHGTTKPTLWDRTDGILSWDVSLAPRTKKTVWLDYTVLVPSDYAVRGY